MWLCLPFVAACASSSLPVPQEWRVVPQAARIDDLCASVQCAPRPASDVKIVDNKLVAGGKELTPRLAAIQSFDVSLERREIVFSAKRSDNFDVGLVSLDGSDIHWIPSDPSDETDVQWAPRGNKVSYIVHARFGDVVRTVHIPTAMELTVPFAYSTVRALAWDPPAEHYAVVLSSPDASERVESMEYSGEKRRTVVPPAVRLDVATEPLGGALVLRPASLRYGERLPLVVWIADPPFVWNDARGKLIRDTRLACAIARQAPDAAFWSVVDAVPWIDSRRIFVVGARSSRGTSIVPTADPGYRLAGNEVLVPRADVESFAASWIPQQLKDRNGVR